MADQFMIDIFKDAGFEIRPYSGRGMMGKQCLAIKIESEADLWELAMAFGQEGYDPPAPRIDSLGRGLIAYWPSISAELETDD